MKSNLKSSLLLIVLCSAFVVNAQFKNGDFKYGNSSASPQVINDWTNSGAQFVPEGFIKSEDSWIDLTGTGYGNGYYIEQTINTVKDEVYYFSFDLGTFFGWDLWDAGVSISMDGNPFGGRIYHSNFSYTQDDIIYWIRMRSAFFIGTGYPVTVRFTGDSHIVQNLGWNRGVGVIALDNVSLEKQNSAGLNGSPELVEFNIFPNPANATLSVSLPNITGDDHNLILTDLAGKVVYSQALNYSENGISINTLDLPSGLYYLNLKQGSALVGTKKVMITH